MKRVHVHLSVPNLEQAVGFYSALFGSPPSLQRSDYAKWLLDDPKLNFALSQLGHGAGLDHLGLQTESQEELRAMTDALKRANVTVKDEAVTTCCYAQSEKGWLHDPLGIAWEIFTSHGEAPIHGVERSPRELALGACCAPADKRDV